MNGCARINKFQIEINNANPYSVFSDMINICLQTNKP